MYLDNTYASNARRRLNTSLMLCPASDKRPKNYIQTHNSLKYDKNKIQDYTILLIVVGTWP